jgi:hypothetical protein
MDRKKIMISAVLAGQRVGVMQVEDQIWQVSFMDYDLGVLRYGQLSPRARSQSVWA